MAQSKHRPKHKDTVKKNNIKKAKLKQQMNILKNQAEEAKKMPISFSYHKDQDTVQVPMKAWQMLNALAKELQPLAQLVSVFEQVGQDHINDGTLIPVFQEDIEPEMKDGAPLVVNGQIQYKLKDAFWAKNNGGVKIPVPQTERKIIIPPVEVPST